MTTANGSPSAPSSQLPAPVLLEERRGATVILTMNRPEARNALNTELVKALTAAFVRLAADDTVRAVVLSGAGPAFCGGADLKTLQGLQTATASQNMADAARLKALFRAVGAFPKPLVAAVHGPALAGGCGLVSLCDVILASPQAAFGYPEVRIGFVAAIVMVFLARQIGERRAKRLLLSGRAVGTEEAVALGLADRAVSAEDLMDQALGEALALQRGAPGALALTKAILWRTSGLPLDAAVDWAGQINTYARTDPDMREGLEAFFDGRKPNWSPP